jgi:plasmid stabilization system protein ParE
VSYFIHPDAETELGDAAVYYAKHASKVIANAFLLEFQRVRDLLIENQQRGSRLEDGLRIYHFNRFPYSIIYEESEVAGLQIFAVAHQSREPGYWIDRT